jgi:riboflavin synthase
VVSKDQGGSWVFRFSYPSHFRHLVIEKGSIALNGVSLTCFEVMGNEFSVAIIPYTLANTNIGQLKVGIRVNIEFDMIGKYVARMSQIAQDDYPGLRNGQA